ncbi:MAG TPA: hypothetical protein VK674_05205 [Candidatus Limnocylindria bacterium]|nr:hypothetical protein [Candidatus Limnocylindria bacterium]
MTDGMEHAMRQLRTDRTMGGWAEDDPDDRPFTDDQERQDVVFRLMGRSGRIGGTVVHVTCQEQMIPAQSFANALPDQPVAIAVSPELWERGTELPNDGKHHILYYYG